MKENCKIVLNFIYVCTKRKSKYKYRCFVLAELYLFTLNVSSFLLQNYMYWILFLFLLHFDRIRFLRDKMTLILNGYIYHGQRDMLRAHASCVYLQIEG